MKRSRELQNIYPYIIWTWAFMAHQSISNEIYVKKKKKTVKPDITQDQYELTNLEKTKTYKI